MENLTKLAEMVGISSEYIDKTGKTHHTTDDVRRCFLTEMGFACENEEQIKTEIRALENEIWLNGVDCVHAFFQSDCSKLIAVYLPQSTDFLHYNLIDENNKIIANGTINLSSITPLENKIITNVTYNKFELNLLPENLADGYYTIKLYANNFNAQSLVIMAPDKCYLPHGMDKEDFRTFGLASQLYAVRSRNNMGIGDFGDLHYLVKGIANQGADILGLNPLGALFSQNYKDFSPYRGLTRSYLNYGYINLPAVEDFQKSTAVQNFMKQSETKVEIERLRQIDKVDYHAVLNLKLQILELMYKHFIEHSKDLPRAQAFTLWKQTQGTRLYNTCLFEAMLEQNSLNEYAEDWRFWPKLQNKIDSPATNEFARNNQQRIDFYAYCHWLADVQLKEVAQLCQNEKMKIGLYLDMPIGASASGAEVWMEPHVYAGNMGVGAPADPMRPKGQSWGFAPYHPRTIRQTGYGAFIDLIRANMQNCKALRIDHAMGLRRLFWIYFIPGNPVVQGAYIYYNMKEMVAILCLESQRHKCIIIGEDLGTVPAGFREYMFEHGLLSYKVFFRQKDKDGKFLPPHDYQYLSVAQASTHDQATTIGFWQNADIQAFNDCGLYVNKEQYHGALKTRHTERSLLVEAFERENTFSSQIAHNDTLVCQDGIKAPIQIEEAVSRYTARANSCLFLQRVEDIYRQYDMENVPGTIAEYPNWRIKLPQDVEDMINDERFARAFAIVKAERK